MPTTKEEAIKEGRAKARFNMENYGSCAQSTVMALQDVLELKDDAVLKASTSMTGGIGRMRDACGGLLGAAMFLGQIYGRDRANIADKEKLGDLMPHVGKLYKWYEKTFGSATCYDIKTLMGDGVYYDSSVPWQAELAKQEGVDKKCDDLVEETVAWVIDHVWEDAAALK